MKENILGLAGGITAFISLALPWWTMTMSSSGMFLIFSADVSIYPYRATANIGGLSATPTVNIWYGWAALVLIMLGGLMGIIGSLVRSTRMILVSGGLLALLSLIVFSVGLQTELSKSAVIPGWPQTGLFSRGSFMGYLNYTAYLSFGFWVALAAAIIMLVASRKKPEMGALQPPPPPPT